MAFLCGRQVGAEHALTRRPERLDPINDLHRTAWKSALAQGFAVLIGILVAFAIDAAWEEQQESRRLTAYLTSLGDELDANRLALEADIERLRAHREEIERYVILVVDPPAPVSQDDLPAMTASLGPLRQRDFVGISWTPTRWGFRGHPRGEENKWLNPLRILGGCPMRPLFVDGC